MTEISASCPIRPLIFFSRENTPSKINNDHNVSHISSPQPSLTVSYYLFASCPESLINLLHNQDARDKKDQSGTGLESSYRCWQSKLGFKRDHLCHCEQTRPNPGKEKASVKDPGIYGYRSVFITKVDRSHANRLSQCRIRVRIHRHVCSPRRSLLRL